MYFTTSLLHNSHDYVFTIRVIRKISNKKINIKSFWSVFQVTGKSKRKEQILSSQSVQKSYINISAEIDKPTLKNTKE